jgi:N-acetylmuramoyl-L-alanine amidase
VRLVTDDTFGVITVKAEAGGEPFLGQVAVAEVILRRAKLRYMSDGTIFGTVTRPYQFSCWNQDEQDRELLYRCLLSDDAQADTASCISAWNQALTSGVDVVPDAVLYCNLDVASPSWAIPTKTVGQIGKHTFFKA